MVKNGYIEKNKNLERSKHIHLYDKIMGTAGQYIEALFDEICQNMKRLALNMNTMNNSLLEEISGTASDGMGYIGYSEWQWLFMNEDKTLIDLNIFCALFPRLNCIMIRQLKSITKPLLNSIYDLLEKTPNINEIDLDKPHIILQIICKITPFLEESMMIFVMGQIGTKIKSS